MCRREKKRECEFVLEQARVHLSSVPVCLHSVLRRRHRSQQRPPWWRAKGGEGEWGGPCNSNFGSPTGLCAPASSVFKGYRNLPPLLAAAGTRKNRGREMCTGAVALNERVFLRLASCHAPWERSTYETVPPVESEHAKVTEQRQMRQRKIVGGWRTWLQKPKQTFIPAHLFNITLSFCNCCNLTFKNRACGFIVTAKTERV